MADKARQGEVWRLGEEPLYSGKRPPEHPGAWKLERYFASGKMAEEPGRFWDGEEPLYSGDGEIPELETREGVKQLPEGERPLLLGEGKRRVYVKRRGMEEIPTKVKPSEGPAEEKAVPKWYEKAARGVKEAVGRGYKEKIEKPGKYAAYGVGEEMGVLSPEQRAEREKMRGERRAGEMAAAESRKAAVRHEAEVRYGTGPGGRTALDNAYRAEHNAIVRLYRAARAKDVDMNILRELDIQAGRYGVDEDMLSQIQLLRKEIEGRPLSKVGRVVGETAIGAAKVGAWITGGLAAGAEKQERQKSIAGIKRPISERTVGPTPTAGVAGITGPILDPWARGVVRRRATYIGSPSSESWY